MVVVAVALGVVGGTGIGLGLVSSVAGAQVTNSGNAVLYCYNSPKASYVVGAYYVPNCVYTGSNGMAIDAKITIDPSSTPGTCVVTGQYVTFEAPGSCVMDLTTGATTGVGGERDGAQCTPVPGGCQQHAEVVPASLPSPSPSPPFAAGVVAAQGCVPMPSGTVVGMAATADNLGYWIADKYGQVDSCGDASAGYGELATAPAAAIVGIESTPSGQGYWLVAGDGAVYSFGNAQYFGSLTGLSAADQPGVPVVGMAVTSSGRGYWLVTTKGDIYSFGDAAFHGSTGSLTLNKPIVGMALDPNSGGYWLDASDGGVFAFDAPFEGSMGGTQLNEPMVGMAPDLATGGYWLVAADGGIFSFSAPFYGSPGHLHLAAPIRAMQASTTGTGYRLVASDGGVLDFGNAPFEGSAAG